MKKSILCSLLAGSASFVFSAQATAANAYAYKPINEIRSIQSLVDGSRLSSRAEADRFQRALTELTLVRPYPLQLDDGVMLWRIELTRNGTFYIRLSDKPCLNWETLIKRFNAKYVLNPHWNIHENQSRYFVTNFTIQHACANEFSIRIK